MENKLNNLDQIIKDTYEAYEAPYDPSHWESIHKDLDTVAPSPVKYFGSITTGLVAASLVFMGMLLFVSEATQNLPVDKEDLAMTEEVVPGGAAPSSSELSAKDVSGTDSETLIESTESEVALETAAGLNDRSENTRIISNADVAVSDIKSQTKKSTIVQTNTAPVKSTNEHSSNKDDAERSVRTGCTGLTIDFEASEDYGRDAKYLWNFGDGFFSNEANPSHTFNKPGTFDVSLSVTSYTTGQITSNVVQAMIDVVEAPVANLDIVLIGGDEMVLKNKSFRANEVEWSMDGESLGFGSEINLNFADNTRYQIELSALSAGGCTDTLYQEIEISNGALGLPKQINFSQQETLTPANFSSEGKMIQFNVVHGGKVKYTSSNNQTWTGEDSSGKILEPGIYEWTMAVDNSGKIMVYKGEFKIF